MGRIYFVRLNRLPFALVALIVGATRLIALPRSFWEGEEVRFALALLTFDPVRFQPDPPGYPLYVALGRAVNFFLRDPLVSLVALSVIASVAGSLLLTAAAERILGSRWAGAAAAIILFCSPAVLVFSPLPNPEAVTLALLSGALFCAVTDRRVPCVLLAAAAIGVQPEVAPAVVVLFAARIGGAPLVFAIALAVIFVPLIEAIGVSRLREYLDLDPSFRRDLVLRFTAHPWGAKFLSFPLLAIAAVGFVTLRRKGIALAAFAAVHIFLCIAFAAANDGVQPVIPALLSVAIFAAAALRRWPVIAVIAAIAYGAASFVYAWPVLRARHSIAPSVQAIRDSRSSLVLCDPTFEPFCDFFNLNWQPVKSFGNYAVSDEPLHMLAQGRSSRAGARTYEWPDSDAYGKITTELYRVVSLVPIEPAARYIPRAGVYAFESAPERGEWQWLAKDSAIDLPARSAQKVVLRLALPPDAPIESNVVSVNGRSATVTRGGTAEVEVPAAPRLLIAAERSWQAADSRDLAVQLMSIEQR